MLTTYPVLLEGKVGREIHIPEYLTEDLCKFPKSEANRPLSSKTLNRSTYMRSGCV